MHTSAHQRRRDEQQDDRVLDVLPAEREEVLGRHLLVAVGAKHAGVLLDAGGRAGRRRRVQAALRVAADRGGQALDASQSRERLHVLVLQRLKGVCAEVDQG